MGDLNQGIEGSLYQYNKIFRMIKKNKYEPLHGLHCQLLEIRLKVFSSQSID